jgi:hypothetical protein
MMVLTMEDRPKDNYSLVGARVFLPGNWSILMVYLQAAFGRHTFKSGVEVAMVVIMKIDEVVRCSCGVLARWQPVQSGWVF